MHKFGTLWVLLAFLLSGGIGLVQLADSAYSAAAPVVYLPLVVGPPDIAQATVVDPFVQQLVDLTNAERAKVPGCPALTLNVQLTAAAYGHSEAMATVDFFSHTGADGSTLRSRVDATGYAWFTLGENIAAGGSTPAQTLNQWMNSDGHRANILNCNFREIGIGYYYQADDQNNVRLSNGGRSGPFYHYWTQVFGSAR